MDKLKGAISNWAPRDGRPVGDCIFKFIHTYSCNLIQFLPQSYFPFSFAFKTWLAVRVMFFDFLLPPTTHGVVGCVGGVSVEFVLFFFCNFIECMHARLSTL